MKGLLGSTGILHMMQPACAPVFRFPWRAGRWLARTVCVPSAPASYDAELARALWDLSADKAGLPR